MELQLFELIRLLRGSMTMQLKQTLCCFRAVKLNLLGPTDQLVSRQGTVLFCLVLANAL